MTRRRRREIKNAFIRSRIPFKAPLARGFLRGNERYLSLREGRDRRTEDGGFAIPPPRLRVLVAGTADVNWFLSTGKAQTDYLRDLLAGVGRPLDEMDTILDFGCGCGRMTRWWSDLSGPQIYGCDYNRNLVDWCDSNLAFVQARTTGLEPPLPYQDCSFDFLCVYSVFTHLSTALASRWMADLRRLIRPGGLLWFTVHGESFRERLLPEEKAQFDAGKIVVSLPEIEGTNLCATYWPKLSVEDMLRNKFEVLVHLDPQADPATAKSAHLTHDAYLVRRV
jgi:SAM-dependent methyltransferase